jgi:drug/metabolite transporter (DMT)-like permease
MNAVVKAPDLSAQAPHVARPLLGIVLLVLCASLWSLNGPLIKLLNQAAVPGISIACYRSLVGGIAFFPFAWGRRGSLRRVHVGWPIAGVLVFSLMTASFVIATTLTQAANAIILQYTSPIWVFLLAFLLLGERAGKSEAIAVVVALVGVGVIYAGNPGGQVLGLSLALLSGVGYGALTVLLRGMRPVNPLVVGALNALGSGLLLLPAALIWGRFELNASNAWLLLVTGLVQFCIPYVLFSWALQHVTASRAALILLLEAILNPLWTWLAIGEQPTPATFVGGPIVLLAAIIAIAGFRTSRRGE